MAVEDELLKELKLLRKSINILAGNADSQKEALKKIPDSIREIYEKEAKRRGETPTEFAQSQGYKNVEDMFQAEYTRVSRASANRGGGLGGFLGSLTAAQLPDPEGALPSFSYGRAFSGGKTTRAFVLGALIKQASAQGAYDPSTGVRYGGIESRGQMLDMLPTPQKREVAERGIRKILGLDKDAFVTDQDVQSVLGAGADISDIGKGLKGDRKLTGPQKETLQNLAEQIKGPGVLRGLAFNSGRALMTGSRLLAGPVGAAVTAAQQAYSYANLLYDPARSAAGLGYGFSANPFSYGAQVSMGRSLQTRMDALFSMGISGQQTAAARAALEGMGVGGLGSEKMYNQYYQSMTEVMKETQLEAGVLAPFYEQFLRQGGTESEVAKLTKMLAEDLPKAATASRMSLQQMAQAVQQTTEAVYRSPYNMRTRSEISQSLIAAQTAGAPPGMMDIAGGANPLMTAQTATRLGTSYFSAMQQPEQLQITTAEMLRSTLGDMTGDQFAEYRLTDDGALKVMMASAMTGMTVDDIQKLYNQGLSNFQAMSALTDTFVGARLGTAKIEKRGAKPRPKGVDVARAGAVPRIKDVVTSQMIAGTDIDLYSDTGADIQKEYAEPIAAMRSILESQDPTKAAEFEKTLNEMKSEQAIKAFNFLKEQSREIANKTATGQNGTIDLSDEAKKYFKLTFDNGEQDLSLPSDTADYGGAVVQ